MPTLWQCWSDEKLFLSNAAILDQKGVNLDQLIILTYSENIFLSSASNYYHINWNKTYLTFLKHFDCYKIFHSLLKKKICQLLWILNLSFSHFFLNVLAKLLTLEQTNILQLQTYKYKKVTLLVKCLHHFSALLLTFNQDKSISKCNVNLFAWIICLPKLKSVN